MILEKVLYVSNAALKGIISKKKLKKMIIIIIIIIIIILRPLFTLGSVYSTSASGAEETTETNSSN